MIEIYRTDNTKVHEKVKILLARKLGGGIKIFKTQNGKPYIEGDPLYFSVTHSADGALIAICDNPIGIDLEFCRPKRYGSILSKFTDNEKTEIGDNDRRFFINWTMKEAYIKMSGGTLARDLKRLEYYKNKLYCDGTEVNCGYIYKECFESGIFALCAYNYGEEALAAAQINVFALQDGEYL